jgi:hypothetical protein
MGFWPQQPVLTDADGRYTITGMPRGGERYS